MAMASPNAFRLRGHWACTTQAKTRAFSLPWTAVVRRSWYRSHRSSGLFSIVCSILLRVGYSIIRILLITTCSQRKVLPVFLRRLPSNTSLICLVNSIPKELTRDWIKMSRSSVLQQSIFLGSCPHLFNTALSGLLVQNSFKTGPFWSLGLNTDVSWKIRSSILTLYTSSPSITQYTRSYWASCNILWNRLHRVSKSSKKKLLLSFLNSSGMCRNSVGWHSQSWTMRARMIELAVRESSSFLMLQK